MRSPKGSKRHLKKKKEGVTSNPHRFKSRDEELFAVQEVSSARDQLKFDYDVGKQAIRRFNSRHNKKKIRTFLSHDLNKDRHEKKLDFNVSPIKKVIYRDREGSKNRKSRVTSKIKKRGSKPKTKKEQSRDGINIWKSWDCNPG